MQTESVVSKIIGHDSDAFESPHEDTKHVFAVLVRLCRSHRFSQLLTLHIRFPAYLLRLPASFLRYFALQSIHLPGLEHCRPSTVVGMVSTCTSLLPNLKKIITDFVMPLETLTLGVGPPDPRIRHLEDMVESVEEMNRGLGVKGLLESVDTGGEVTWFWKVERGKVLVWK